MSIHERFPSFLSTSKWETLYFDRRFYFYCDVAISFLRKTSFLKIINLKRLDRDECVFKTTTIYTIILGNLIYLKVDVVLYTGLL